MARAPHTADAWLVAPAARGHGTDLRGVAPGRRVAQAASAVTRRIEVVVRDVAGPSYVSTFGIWMGGAGRPTMVSTPIHGTSAWLVNTWNTGHNTNALLLRPTAVSHTTNVYAFGAGSATNRTDVLGRATQTQAHDTSTRVALLTTAARTYTTDIFRRGTSAPAHTTDARIARLTTVPAQHATDTDLRKTWTKVFTTDLRIAMLAAYPRVQSTDADCAGVVARAHTTSTKLPLVFVLPFGTDSKLWRSCTWTHTADALKWRPVTRNHKTDIYRQGVYARIHTTDTLGKILPLRGHFTDLALWRTRSITTYTDVLHRRTSTHVHATDLLPCYAYTDFHTTDVAVVGTHGWAHTADATLAVTWATGHASDAQVQYVPAVFHGTDVFRTVPRARLHTADALATRTPPTGRWAAPRVGTRVPAQVSSRERQQGTYPIEFLLVSHDRITPVPGAVVTVQLLKPGATVWVPAQGTVTDVGNGWYALANDPRDGNVLGEFVLMATAPGAEPSFVKYDIVAPDPYAYITLSPAERNAAADATLIRAFASVASVPARCLLQALRAIWSWKTTTGGTMTVVAENGTPAWQATVVIDPTVKPTRGMDPT